MRLLFIITLLAAMSCYAQVRTPKLTVYKQFKPSTIQLRDGRKLQQPLTNIFLKNSSLLYLKGSDPMEANMSNIISVKFDDRLYVKIDTLLAYQVDSVDSDALFCATVIDMPSYVQQLKNNQVITSLDLGDQISTATIDLSSDEDFLFPLINIYYYRYKGKFVRVHERNLTRVLSKEQRRLMKSQMAVPGFSWQSEESLLRLLKAIQRPEQESE